MSHTPVDEESKTSLVCPEQCDKKVSVAILATPQSATIECQTLLPQDKVQKTDNFIRTAAVLASSLYGNDTKNGCNELWHFLRQLLKRSRIGKNNVVLAVYYMFKLKDKIKARFETNDTFLQCAKRLLLTCLIVASKFLNDNTYSVKAWNVISGLSAKELSTLERTFLKLMNYELYVKEEVFQNWEKFVDAAEVKLVVPSRVKRAREDSDAEIPIAKKMIVV